MAERSPLPPRGFPAIGLWGRAAREALREGARGRVLAVFRRSVVVEMEDGGLACVGGHGLEPGPLNALCDLPDAFAWPDAPLRSGEPVGVTGHTLALGPISLDLAGAGSWRPPVLAPPAPARIQRGLALLRGEGLAAAPPRGLARLLLPCTPDLGVRGDPATDAPVLAAGAAAEAALRAWLRGCPPENDQAGVPQALVALLGLGPGLTPAGDDWLGGTLIALHALGATGPARQLADTLLRQSLARTSTISAAHLRCAVAGEGAAALHRTLQALWEGEGGNLPEGLRRLDALGHTSGWDALAGAVAALSAWAEHRPSRPPFPNGARAAREAGT